VKAPHAEFGLLRSLGGLMPRFAGVTIALWSGTPVHPGMSTLVHAATLKVQEPFACPSVSQLGSHSLHTTFLVPEGTVTPCTSRAM